MLAKDLMKNGNDVSASQEQLIKLEREFLELRIAKHTGQIKDTSRFKKIRAEIARLKQSMSAKR
jgi:ribosomal protein L29